MIQEQIHFQATFRLIEHTSSISENKEQALQTQSDHSM